MKPDLTDTLCTRCGLCCDGSLFADVELAGRAEADRLVVLGLEIDDDDDTRGGLLVQPCAALRGRRCSIYPHRPGCCRTFECRLLQDARNGTVSVESALARISEALGLIRRGKTLLARLGQHGARLPLKERAAEVLAGAVVADRVASARRAQLTSTMAALEALVRQTFLGEVSGR